MAFDLIQPFADGLWRLEFVVDVASFHPLRGQELVVFFERFDCILVRDA